MSCSRKKKVKPPKKGHYQCQACGQVRKKDGKLCKPEKIAKTEQARDLQCKNAHKLCTAVLALALVGSACRQSTPTDPLSGVIAFVRRNDASHLELWRIDANGQNETLVFSNTDPTNPNILFPRWRQGRIEFLGMRDGRWGLWSIAPNGGDIRTEAGDTDERMVSRDSRVPDLEVREGEVHTSEGTKLSSWRLYDGKLNPGASEASWAPDRRHAVFQACRTGGVCKVHIARADGSREWDLTRGRQPSWGP